MLFEDVTCGSWVGPRQDPVSMGGRWTGAPGLMAIGREGSLVFNGRKGVGGGDDDVKLKM